jgi:hypothetical protein
MSYVIGTTENRVKWYQFNLASGEVVAVHSVLDLSLVNQFHNKDSAKIAAQNAGLKTWRYVQLK